MSVWHRSAIVVSHNMDVVVEFHCLSTNETFQRHRLQRTEDVVPTNQSGSQARPRRGNSSEIAFRKLIINARPNCFTNV